MSWLNISGSLSSISNNISSFTREVLTEASTNVYKDSDKEQDSEESDSEHMLSGVEAIANDTVDLMTTELEHLKLEISSKDEQIHLLEQENNKLQMNFEKHVTKLRQHIHDKDEEVEILVEKLKNLEADFVGKIEDLTFERDSLNAKLDAKDNEWGNNWSSESNNDEELENLKLENESYSNELMMKEIVLNSIEARMREISKKDIDAADFSVWLDEHLQDNKERIVLKWLSSVLTNKKFYPDLTSLEKSEQWLVSIIEEKNKNDALVIELEKKVINLQTTIKVIEKSICDYDENSQQEFQIEQFEEWIASFKKCQIENSAPIIDVESQVLLNKIQAEIREFDVEDEDFNIQDFSKWIEKVQVRIDELEVELINEQEIREKNEKQRSIERAKLEELFLEKQNEIALLKVELYNKTNFVETNVNETEVKDDLYALQEQLNEMHARCDAFKDELTCSHAESDKLLQYDKENKLLIEDLRLSNKTFEEKICELEMQIEQYFLKNSELENEKVELQKQVDALVSQSALVNQKTVVDVLAETECCFRCLQNETAAKLADDKSNKLKIRVANLIRQKEKLEKDYSHSVTVSQELTEHNEVLRKQQESQHLFLEHIQSLFNDVGIKDILIDDVIKLDSNDDNQQLFETIRKFVTTCLLLQKKNIELTNALEKVQQKKNTELTNTLAEKIPQKVVESMTEAHSFVVDACSSSDYDDLSTSEQTDNIQLKLDLNENNFDVHEIYDLRKRIAEQENQIKELCAAKSKSFGENNKFGSLKRKLQETEDLNKMLLAENNSLRSKLEETPMQSGGNEQFQELLVLLNTTTQESQFYQQKCSQLEIKVSELSQEIHSVNLLKEECELMLLQQQQNESSKSTSSSEVVLHQQIHQLSLMLTEKSEEFDRLFSEYNNIKTKLLFIENETSDMDLIREECKQLKTMLIDKENQIKIDETVSLLQNECQQLKNLLVTYDAENRKLQQLNLEKENELSDMYLVREECKQLKQMLINRCESSTAQKASSTNQDLDYLQSLLQDKDLEIQKQSAVIIDLQNMSSNMEFVQEECKQLKKMLLDSTVNNVENFQNNSLTIEEPNSFMVQVQQLEEFLHEKEVEIEEKNSELQKQTKEIASLQDSISNMEFIQVENKSLKKMLSEKEEFFAELQNDIDGANLMLQLKNDDIKQREKQLKEIEILLQQTVHSLQSKEQEYELLQQELNESILQDENIHILQTEYRGVEEKLHATSKELIETQKRLFDVESHLNQMKIYEEQCCELSKDLRLKDEALQHLKMQLSETAILENETITNFQNELVELKRMVLDKETQLNQLNDAFAAKTVMLQNMNTQYAEATSLINDLTSKIESKEETILQLKLNFSSFDEAYSEKIKRCEVLEASEHKLQEEIDFLKSKLIEQDMVEKKLTLEKINSMQGEKEVISENIQACSLIITDLNNGQNEIVEEGTSVANEFFSVENNSRCSKCEEINLQLMEIYKAVTDLNFLQPQDYENINVVRPLNELITATPNKDINQGSFEMSMHEKCLHTINELSLKLKFSVDNIEKLKEMYELKYIDMESQILEYKELESMYQSEYIEKESLQTNYKTKCFEYKDLEELYKSKSAECQGLEATVTKYCSDLNIVRSQYEEKCHECISLKERLNTQKREYLVEVDCIKKSHSDSLNDSLEENHLLKKEIDKLSEDRHHETHLLEDEIALMQSQHIEKLKVYEEQLSEMESLFKQEMEKVLKKQEMEKDDLVKNLQQQVQDLQKHIQNTNAQNCTECIKLREELEQNTCSLLEKINECDQLRVDVLKLEEKLYEAQNSKLQFLDENEFNDLKSNAALKDEKIKQLTLALEDNEARLENARKERILLEDFALQKAELENEKKSWLLEKQLLTQKIQELEVLIKHKEVQHKENEAKIARELERLRNHLITTEDNHTKDILDLHEKEIALQKELEEVKDTLKRKNIILNDSSKQFQEHVFSIEERLHHVSSQRDLNLLDLSKYKEKIEHDKTAIINLQHALEQLENEKREQYDYLVSLAKRKQDEMDSKIKLLLEEQQVAKRTMEEASLAVQGISKLTNELNQKEQELVNKQNKINELTLALEQRNTQYKNMQVASDGKIDKFLIANLLLRYFQSPSDKRSDILQVVGGLLGWSHHDIKQIGDGTAPSKGWISNVWGFTTPKKQLIPVNNQPTNMNQSFSELFVKFLETETDHKPKMNAASLLNDTPSAPNVVMFSPTPDILTFHNSHKEKSQLTRIPAPGQEIPRVHTHQAQTALKTILS